MQQSLSRRPDVEQAPFEVSLVSSELVHASADNTAMMHAALNAAKHAQWSQLEAVLFPPEEASAECVLPSKLVNSVPDPRDYGIVHQLAHHGAVAAYRSLIERGLLLDTTMLTAQSGETAEQIATKRGHTEFAALMACAPQLAAQAAAASGPVLGAEGVLSYQLDGKGKFVEGGASILCVIYAEVLTAA